MVKINRFSFRKENRQIEKELARSLLLIQGYPIPEGTAAEMVRRSPLKDNERFKFIKNLKPKDIANAIAKVLAEQQAAHTAVSHA